VNVTQYLAAKELGLGGAPLTAQFRGEKLTQEKIFISHASADSGVADLLRDTLILGGVPADRLFYSSARGSGIPAGRDVQTRLRLELQDARMVVELISPTFLRRPMCLIELGAAWVLEKSTYPIVVPPLTRDEAVRNIGNVHMGQLKEDRDIEEVFDELHDRLTNELQITLRTTDWNRASRDFKRRIGDALTTVKEAVDSVSSSDSAPSQPRPAAPSAAKVSIDSYDIVSNARGSEIHGEATNNDTFEHGAVIKATFYDDAHKIVGTADGIVSQLAPGETKTFSLLSLDGIPAHSDVKVQVDTIF
jgi:hypothetical protein